MRAYRWGIGGVLLVSLAAACGGGRSTTAHTPVPLPAALVARANAICTQGSPGAFPYPTFDPQHPDPSLLPKVGAFFAATQAASDAVPGDLRRLSVPSNDKTAWNQLLSLAKQYRTVADNEIKAAQASDSTGFVTAVNQTEPILEQIAPLADQLGFDSASPCRQAAF